WPGNVRELGNLVERLSILCAGRPVGVADLPSRYRPIDWTPAPDSDRIADIFASVAPPATADATMAVEATLQLEHQTRLSEREVLLVLEDPVTGTGTVLPPGGMDLRAHVSAIEESLIRQALERSNGVVAQAARLLGLRRTTLVEQLRKFGIGGVDEASGSSRRTAPFGDAFHVMGRLGPARNLLCTPAWRTTKTSPSCRASRSSWMPPRVRFTRWPHASPPPTARC